MLDNALILRSQNSSDMMPSLSKPGVTKRIPGGPVSLQSLAQPYNTPEADNQGLAWYTGSFHAGVLRQVGAILCRTPALRTEFGDP